METFIAALLTLYFIGSLLNNSPKRIKSKIPNIRYMRFLPLYSFFAPIPLMGSYYILVKRFMADHSTKWQELNLSSKRNIRNFVFDKNKREKKALIDSIQSLLAYIDFKGDGQDHAIRVSYPYLLLLNTITHLPHKNDVDAIQFCVAKQSEKNTLSIIFLSEKHRLS